MVKRTSAAKLLAGRQQARADSGTFTRQPDPVVRAYTAEKIREFLGFGKDKDKS